MYVRLASLEANDCGGGWAKGGGWGALALAFRGKIV